MPEILSFLPMNCVSTTMKYLSVSQQAGCCNGYPVQIARSSDRVTCGRVIRTYGSVGDFNHGGKLDLFYANYGSSWLMHNDGGGHFTDVAPEMGVVVSRHLVSAGWGDYDNDGLPYLYADGYLSGHPNIRDYLFHNEGTHFTDVTSPQRKITCR